MTKAYDAAVVGSGPNGLAAAIALARKGLTVLVVEGSDTLGGGARTLPLTLPGFAHDICSAVYPMAVSSPFFRELPLERHGLRWAHPPALLAHPLDNGTAGVLYQSVDETAAALGDDADAYRRLMGPLARAADDLLADMLGPFRLPRHPLTAFRFARAALRSGKGFAEAYFKTEKARALWAGSAAHAVIPLDQRPGAAIALMLTVAGHARGWPLVAGGAQNLSNALLSYFRSLGGEVEAGRWVKTVDDLPPAKAVVLDVTPRQLVAMAGHRLPDRYKRRLGKFRYGPGVFKVDWALAGPVPWTAPECRGAGTVHLGGTLDEVASSERAAFDGHHTDKPFVLYVQPGVCDPSRAPAGQHTGWAYCHVPNGSTEDMTERIEAQVERFAPGFRSLILARHTRGPAAMEAHNPNYVGGDIGGGVVDLGQLFTRPVARWDPYSTPDPGLFLCSSSTPPGGGVHGMCGYFAALSVLRRLKIS
jgi:phytoene dehydrogenase-like protein